MYLDHATRYETDICLPKHGLLMLSGENLLDEHIAHRETSHKFYLSNDSFGQYLHPCTDFYLIAFCVDASSISLHYVTRLKIWFNKQTTWEIDRFLTCQIFPTILEPESLFPYFFKQKLLTFLHPRCLVSFYTGVITTLKYPCLIKSQTDRFPCYVILSAFLLRLLTAFCSQTLPFCNLGGSIIIVVGGGSRKRVFFIFLLILQQWSLISD
jgi:hypothetical protein